MRNNLLVGLGKLLFIGCFMACSGGNGGVGPDPPPPPPPPNPTVSLLVSPGQQTMGGEVLIELQSQNTLSCTLSWTGETSTSGTWRIRVENPGKVTYRVTCTGASGTTPVEKQVEVMVLPPSPTASLSASVDSVVRGEKSTLSWTSTNATSCSAPWTNLTSAQGVQDITPSATQKYSIACVGPGGSVTSNEVTVIVTDPPVVIPPFSVQVFAPQPTPEGVRGLRFYLFLGSKIDSVDIRDDGVAIVSPSSALPDSFFVAVDAQNQASRQFHPMDIKVGKNDVAQGLRIPLVPYSWKIENGTFLGQTIRTSLDTAYTPSEGTNLSFFRRAPLFVGGPAPWVYSVHSWPVEKEVLIGFDRSLSPILPSDSATIMGFFKELETLTPYRFRAVNVSSLPAKTGVRIILDDKGFLGAGAEFDATNGTIHGGRITAYGRSPLLSRTAIQHEMLHVFAMGHTCSWKSVMYSNCPPNWGSERPVAQDIAHLELWNRIIEIQRRENTPWGIPHAFQGHRVRVLKQPRESFRLSGFIPGQATTASLSIAPHSH